MHDQAIRRRKHSHFTATSKEIRRNGVLIQTKQILVVFAKIV